MRTIGIAIAGVVVAGCSTVQPEPAYTTPKGNTAIVVVNRTGAPLCSFTVESRRDNEIAWDALAIEGRPFAAHHPLPPAWQLTVGVKPGAYKVTAKTCDGMFAVDTGRALVTRPTTIELTADATPPADAPRGTVMIALHRVRDTPIPVAEASRPPDVPALP